MEVQGSNLFMAGEITSRTPRNFERKLAANPQVQTIVLTQMSGSLDDGAVLRMGYALREAGLEEIRRVRADGTASFRVDLDAVPNGPGTVAASAGQTWNFQAWYRDTSATGPTSNFSNGLEIAFQ